MRRTSTDNSNPSPEPAASLNNWRPCSGIICLPKGKMPPALGAWRIQSCRTSSSILRGSFPLVHLYDIRRMPLELKARSSYGSAAGPCPTACGSWATVASARPPNLAGETSRSGQVLVRTRRGEKGRPGTALQQALPNCTVAHRPQLRAPDFEPCGEASKSGQVLVRTVENKTEFIDHLSEGYVRSSDSTPWRNACSNWAGARSRWWMMTWAGRLPGPSLAPALNAWWQKCVWGRWAQWRRGRYRDSHVPAGSANSWSK